MSVVTIEDSRPRAVLDKGYAWIVLIGVSLTTFLEMGNFKSFGIYFVLFLEEFKASATMTALINAVYAFSFSLFVLPVETMIVERFSCRRVLIVGGLATTVALVLSSFARRIEILILTNGILLALGSACTHGPSMIILGKYFDKRRGLTNSVAISLGSLGGFVQPILFTSMMREFGLRGALLIQGGILFNCVLGAAIARPVEVSAKFAEHDKKSKMKEANAKSEEMRTLKSIDDQDDRNREIKSEEDIDRKTVENGNLRQRLEFDHASENNFKTSNTSIAQYSSAFDLYSVSIADITHTVEASSSESVQKKRCPKIVDFSILKNKLVSLFTVVFFLASIASCTAFLFVPPHAKDRGVSEQDVSIVASLISVSEFVGRLLIATIADRKCLQRYQIIMFALFMNGVTLQFSWFLNDASHFIAFTICYGMFSGALVSLYAPVCVDFIGVDKFHKAMGILHMGQGIAVGVAGFVIGLMRDYTGSYVAGFHVMGGCGFIAGGLLLLVPRLREKTQRNQQLT